MGCDIHVNFEYKIKTKDGTVKWLDCTPKIRNRHYGVYKDAKKFDDLCWFSRNYDAFALLADVRNYSGIDMIAPCKGVPDDASDEVLEEIKDWGGCGHSHSYFTLQDLEYYCLKHTEPICKSSFNDNDVYARDLLDEYIKVMRFLFEKIFVDDEACIRMVFWFDN